MDTSLLRRGDKPYGEVRRQIREMIDAGHTNSYIASAVDRSIEHVCGERKIYRAAEGRTSWEPTKFVSLPSVSILNTDEPTEADFRAGKAALSAAGLA